MRASFLQRRDREADPIPADLGGGVAAVCYIIIFTVGTAARDVGAGTDAAFIRPPAMGAGWAAAMVAGVLVRRDT
jgi:hypothetical protein